LRGNGNGAPKDSQRGCKLDADPKASLHRLADRVARKFKALVVVTATSLAYTRDDGVHVVPLGVLGP
jgi:hypothetical protein